MGLAAVVDLMLDQVQDQIDAIFIGDAMSAFGLAGGCQIIFGQ